MASGYVGHCGDVKIVDGDCSTGASGLWQLRSPPTDTTGLRDDCINMCQMCENCNFISYTPKAGICAWYRQCDTLRIEPMDSGHRTLAFMRDPCHWAGARNQQCREATERDHTRRPLWVSNASAAGALYAQPDGSAPDGRLVDSSMERHTDWKQVGASLVSSRERRSLGLWWRRYLTRLYGSPPAADPPRGPPHASLDIAYSWPTSESPAESRPLRVARRAAPTLAPTLAPNCPSAWGAPYLGRVVHAPREAIWLARRAPFTPLADGTWAEVTHCAGGWNEAEGHWMYVARGSGLFVNIGRTRVFHTHDEAARAFLPPLNRCEGEMWCHYGHCVSQCDRELPNVLRAAALEGYTSLQFIHHCDMRCNVCGHELVLLGIPGGEACHPRISYRRGWNASLPCTCHASATRTSERGKCAACIEEGSGG